MVVLIVGILGKPGSGKSTYLARYVAHQFWAEFWNAKFDKLHVPKRFRFHTYSRIYSTEPIPGTYLVQPYVIGSFEPAPGSLFLIGEAGSCFSNRAFSRIPPHCTSFFSQHRHYHCDIVWDSQSPNVDLVLRSRTQYMYLCEKGFLFRSLSFLRFIKYNVTVDNDSHDLVEGYSISSGIGKIFGYLFGSNKILIRPLYYKYFDTCVQNLKFTTTEEKGVQYVERAS